MTTIIGIAALTFLGSAVGTLAGFGTSTVMVPVLLFLLTPAETLLFAGLIHLSGDVWKLILFRKGADWRLLVLFGIPGMVFSILGGIITFSLPEETLTRIVGAILIVYVAFLVGKSDFKLPKRTTTAIIGGTAYGFMAGLTGIGGAVRSAFLSVFKLKKAVYLFMTGAIAFVIDASRIGTYLVKGATVVAFSSYWLLLFVPVSFVGALAAKRVLRHIPEKRFSVVIKVSLLLIGIKLMVFP